MTFLHALFKRLPIFDDAGLYHFAEQVVTLPGTLADSGKDGESVVFLGNVVYQFLD